MIRPPVYINLAIRRVFPRVRLVWWRKLKKWAMVDVNKGKIYVIATVDPPLTIKNTLGKLKEIFVGHLKSIYQKNEFLNKIDMDNQKLIDESKAKLKEAIYEAAPRIYRVKHPFVGIINPWRKKNNENNGGYT